MDCVSGLLLAGQILGGDLQVQEIIAEIDQEIARLQQARSLLAGDQPRRGRPRGSRNTTKASTKAAPAKPARKMTAEGRKRIAEAMRKRWAERKKAGESK
jgi:hypothetical protein